MCVLKRLTVQFQQCIFIYIIANYTAWQLSIFIQSILTSEYYLLKAHDYDIRRHIL